MVQKKSTAEKSKKALPLTLDRNKLISMYMEYVLEHDTMPKNIYKFCKDNGITEDQFYEFYGSFDGLRKGIWNEFYDNTMSLLMQSPEFESFTTREKLLTFYYTFFELLTANRSYVLFTLSDEPEMMKNLEQLKGLRKRVKEFARGLIQEGNEDKSVKILKQPETIFSEATWLQLLFILKFWKDDNSPKFESTDVAIEKSVNTVFDIFDNTPLERILDLGKFLWKERRG